MSRAATRLAKAIAHFSASSEQPEKSTGTRIVLIESVVAVFLKRLLFRTIKTGQGECCTTRSAMLPRKTCLRPVRPCVGMTMRSAGIARAIAQISSNTGAPITASQSPVNLFAFAKILRCCAVLFRASFFSCSIRFRRAPTRQKVIRHGANFPTVFATVRQKAQGPYGFIFVGQARNARQFAISEETRCPYSGTHYLTL